jgi:UDP-2,3-diacylglucosamine pyrophosphatase LpxH
MKIAAISDLHIGPRPGTDAFGHQDGAFAAFLDALLVWADVVVLLGDVWQADHGLRRGPAAEAAQLHAARARSPWLTDRLRDPKLRLVHGNHDRIAREELGAATALRLGPPGQEVLLSHGDAWDAVIDKAPLLSATGTWICGRLRGAGLPGVADALEHHDVEIKAQRVHAPGGPTLRSAHAAARAAGVHMLVMGHTHVNLDDSLEVDGHRTRVLNTGTCSRGRWSGVAIDLSRGAAATVADAAGWRRVTEGAVCPR